MDDPFGCLRGVESVEHDLYKLTSETAEKKFNELPRINHCPSCEVHLVNMINKFCRECPECHRVFEYDDDDQFQEVSSGRSAAPHVSPALLAHLKTVLRKWKINEMFSFNQISFLGNVFAQFQAKTGKPVNYPCFLHNYFEMVPSEGWPYKKEIMESIFHRLPKSFAARRCAKQEFDEWRRTISVSNPTPTFVLN